HISWNLTIGFFTENGLIEFIYKTIGFIMLYFIIPLLWEGKTAGTAILRFKLTDIHGNIQPWHSLLRRFFELYLPWVLSAFLNILTGIEPGMDSSLYAYHALITAGMFAFLVIIWIVLFVHAIFVIAKKGNRTFYFDDAARIIPRKE